MNDPTPSAATEEVPRGFRRWWIEPFRSTDDSAWPFIHSVGFKGRFRHKFFSLSLAWGTKKAKTWCPQAHPPLPRSAVCAPASTPASSAGTTAPGPASG